MRRSARLLLKWSGLRPVRLALRHRGITGDDLFIASYPRSGSTWLRFLLYQALTGESAEFTVVNRSIPYVGRHRAAPALLPGGGRLIKTHEPYLPVYRRAIYVARDVRDVVRSEHRYERMRGHYRGGFDRFLRDFLADRLHGLGTWERHVGSWLDSGLGPDALLVVRFEDLQRDTADVLARALAFLGAAVDRGRLQGAIAGNTVERMRQKEDRAGMKKARPQLRHVDRGAVGGWQERLTPEQAAALERQSRPGLARLGYPLAHPA